MYIHGIKSGKMEIAHNSTKMNFDQKLTKIDFSKNLIMHLSKNSTKVVHRL